MVEPFSHDATVHALYDALTTGGTVEPSTGGALGAGTGATSLGKAEDAAHASGDTGVAVWGVRNGAGTVFTSADGDYSPIAVDPRGQVIISGTPTTGGVVRVEDAASADGESGVVIMAIRRDTNTATTSADGDYTPISTDSFSRIRTSQPPGTLANGAETAVSSSAVSVLAANTSRAKLILQNTGANAVRIGIAGVTATTGFRLSAGAISIFDMPHCPTNQIFAIRETADSTVLAQEITG